MPSDALTNVLLVDDSTSMVAIMRKLLGQIGFADVDDANDGAQALTKLRSKRYGLIISDWNMQPMTGIDLLREVRSDPGLKRLPFILMTGQIKTENVIAAKKAGVDNYIVKPFSANTLKEKIDAVLAV